MDLIEIGTILRDARERKGLSIEAVEEKIKIAPSVIIALEEGTRERFPHPVYARGFVRSYAMLLGLDAVDLCAHFSLAYPVPVETERHEPSAPQITVKLHDSGHVITAVRVGAIIGILAIGALGWYAFDVYRSRSPQAFTPPVQESVAPPAAPVQTPQINSLPAPLTQMQEVKADTQVNPGDVSGHNASADIVGPSAKPDATIHPSTNGSSAHKPVVAGTERVLRISANAASWLQARPDDKVVDYFLRKGESTTIVFSKSLSIKFGNAGGVKLELDGKPYHFDAELGEVKTLVVE